VVVRGIAWFAVYLLLALLPAAVALLYDPFPAPRPAWIELGVALGLLAFPLVMIQFALVSRLAASSRPFGTDALVQFHQYIGLVCLALVIAHPLALNATGLPWQTWNPFAGALGPRSGALALWAIVLLVGSTLLRKRLRLPYEVWQGLHLALSIGAAAAMTIHVLVVNGYARAAPVRYVLLAYTGIFGLLAVNYRVFRPLRLLARGWEVVANRDIGGRSRLIGVRPVGHRGLRFEPGQFAWLITGRSPLWSEQHPLSIASSAECPPEEGIEFSIKALGDWSSTVVPQLAVGSPVWIDGPFGAFTTERKAAQGFVFIAGGAGIAPIRSMLLTMRDRCDRRHVVLIQAAHDETKLVFRDEIEALRAALNLDVVFVLEEPLDPGTGECGYVSKDVLVRRLPAQFRRYHYFVCGPPPMMDTVERALVSLGVPGRSIDSERFNVV
jgi:predicted ferric reductase